MTPRTRSQDLTADLLHDLEREAAASTVVGSHVPALALSPAKPEPAPFVEASLYLAPRAWQRPALSQARGSISASVGPVRLRIGRRSS
ncbi:MAG: hypothetical protein QOJ56_5561 [Mycobacterium sp.]|jgi:hypothetical protein|nr:hypothetical protein [Mycobacterium sp.]